MILICVSGEIQIPICLHELSGMHISLEQSCPKKLSSKMPGRGQGGQSPSTTENMIVSDL